MTPPSLQRGMSTCPVLLPDAEVHPLLLELLGHVLVRVHDDRAPKDAARPSPSTSSAGGAAQIQAAARKQTEKQGDFFHGAKGYSGTLRPVVTFVPQGEDMTA